MSSKFLQNSLNYLESDDMKKNVLKNILDACNNQNMVQKTKTSFTNSTCYVVNNNKKYYLFVYSKKNNTNQLYFFNQDLSDEFYIEIPQNKCFTKQFYLFEGYIYTKPTLKIDYKITDILFMDNTPVPFEFPLRYNLVNNIIFDNLYFLSSLNGNLSITIHPILENDGFIELFKKNFVYKNSLVGLEKVSHYDKVSILFDVVFPNAQKIIKRGEYPDVYTVENIETKNNEGILYVKGLADSKFVRETLKHQDSCILECSWDPNIRKWKVAKMN